MLVYLCGVFNGPLTGQKQTLLAIKSILGSKFDLQLMNAPSLDKYFLFSWLAYITRTLSKSLVNNEPCLLYTSDAADE